MSDPAPGAPAAALVAGGPLTVRSERVLFRSPAVRQRQAASLARLDGGRLLLTFRMGTGPQRRNDGAIMLTASDDGGEHWEEPRPLYAHPGWDCFPMGGLVRFADDRLWLILGRIRFDSALGGDEPMDGWYTAGDRVPRRRADVVGARARDPPLPGLDGAVRGEQPPPPLRRALPLRRHRHAGARPRVARRRHVPGAARPGGRRGPASRRWCPSPGPPGRNFADADVVRLADGRFLAVIREMVTRQAFRAHSADEGRTWSPVRARPASWGPTSSCSGCAPAPSCAPTATSTPSAAA